ncbi:hypothetical protein PPL_10462 [Heterostelium album PN500]|uniref:Uncharacterized protein n=1 Tax=Heterostelium pallidum (strain ATCC 26659 / Pp 5 / PN500) TaxID=670386 RepID=D3BR58_HETP5|nr:hypothetical protein PPL_10462 [Heterostelium album PN500]EFA75890.1 hypothetical protein PPL_10462 [Heterostelium album PN500]|eukprot:XP_020428024.1 hypothetical protein PPL_10462 [Heterostelium album PN500]
MCHRWWYPVAWDDLIEASGKGDVCHVAGQRYTQIRKRTCFDQINDRVTHQCEKRYIN